MNLPKIDDTRPWPCKKGYPRRGHEECVWSIVRVYILLYKGGGGGMGGEEMKREPRLCSPFTVVRKDLLIVATIHGDPQIPRRFILIRQNGWIGVWSGRDTMIQASLLCFSIFFFASLLFGGKGLFSWLGYYRRFSFYFERNLKDRKVDLILS